MSLIVPVRKELEERAACISVMHGEKSNLYFLPPKKGVDAFLSRLSCPSLSTSRFSSSGHKSVPAYQHLDNCA